MKTLLFSAVMVFVSLAVVRGGLPEEVIFTLSGKITSVSGVDEISDESTFTGIIVCDSDAPVLGAPSDYEVVYRGTSLSVLIDGSYSIQTQHPDITVWNDAPFMSVFVDSFSVRNHVANAISSPFSDSLSAFAVDFLSSHQSPGQGPLTSTDLPLSIDVDGFQMKRLFIGDGSNITIEGTVDAIEAYFPDDDSDGIQNSLDMCPNTPRGLPVKPNGCVEGDYDNDGDIDGHDLAVFSERFGL